MRVKVDSARDEFVSEYSVPRIITQYQGLLLSTRDYYSVSGIITQYQGLLLSTRDYLDFYFLLDQIGRTGRSSFGYFCLFLQPRSHSLPPFNVLFSTCTRTCVPYVVDAAEL